jgi:hypothetical protein
MASSLEKQVHVEDNISERCGEQWDYEFPVVNQQFCLMSIVDCEDPKKPAAVKVFGCYPSVDAANAAATKISSECDFFHVYVCPTNAWVPVPPSSEFIENVQYQESRMREIQETFAALKDRKAKDVIRHLNKESEVSGAITDSCDPST